MGKKSDVTAFAAGALIPALVLAGAIGVSAVAQAEDQGAQRDEAAKILLGLEVAPVPLNLEHRNRALVGLGSYLVNVLADCDGCHTADAATEYAPGGNPYFKGNQPKVVNQATYLAGGNHFVLVPGLTPDIVSRNLTPDRTGRPVGGRTYEEFLVPAVQRRPAAGHAVAHLSEHDRSRTAGHLRVSPRNSVHRRAARRRAAQRLHLT